MDVAVDEAEPSGKVCETEDAPASFKSVEEGFHSVRQTENVRQARAKANLRYFIAHIVKFKFK